MRFNTSSRFLSSGDSVLSIIIPVFHRFPAEGAIIGRLVLGYSELELMMAYCTSLAVDAEQDDILRAIFRIRSESNRIGLVDALIGGPLKKLGLFNVFTDIKGALGLCLKIRNQFAHCQWADTAGGIFFANLDESAEKAEGFKMRYYHVDLSLLEAQETYFVATRMYLFHLEYEIKLKKGAKKVSPWKKPSMPPKPSLHNPEALHPYP